MRFPEHRLYPRGLEGRNVSQNNQGFIVDTVLNLAVRKKTAPAPEVK